MNPKYSIGDILAVPAEGGEIKGLVLEIKSDWYGDKYYEILNLDNNEIHELYTKNTDFRWTVRKLA